MGAAEYGTAEHWARYVRESAMREASWARGRIRVLRSQARGHAEGEAVRRARALIRDLERHVRRMDATRHAMASEVRRGRARRGRVRAHARRLERAAVIGAIPV